MCNSVGGTPSLHGYMDPDTVRHLGVTVDRARRHRLVAVGLAAGRVGAAEPSGDGLETGAPGYRSMERRWRRRTLDKRSRPLEGGGGGGVPASRREP